MDRRDAIQRQFGATAASYRVSAYHSAAPDLQALVAAARLRGDERVLDVGTGTGHTALALAAAAAEVVGVDLTPAMLDQARSLAAERGIGNVRFEAGDAQALPWPEASFDVVACRVCAHHFADPAAAVREAARVLRPGGTVLWLDTVAPEDPAQDTFLNCIELLRDPSHVRDHTVAQWQAMFAAAGLTAAVVDSWRTELPFDDWTERMQTPAPTRKLLLQLLAGATAQIREAFSICAGTGSAPASFRIPIALLRAVGA